MEFDVNKVRTKVLVKYPYFGTITSNVIFYEDERIKTACTDGYNIYYNPKFMNKFNLGQQVFIVAHEISHIAFNHINRCKDKNRKVWNIATDAVINAFLQEDGLPKIDNIIDFPWASGFTAEELYEAFLKNKELFDKVMDELRKQRQQQKQENGEEDQDSEEMDGDEDSFGHDSHERWDSQKDKKKGKGSSSDKGDKDKDGDQDQNGEGNEDEDEDSPEERRRKKRIQNQQEELEEEGEKKAFNKNKGEKKDLLEKMREQSSQDSLHQAGNQPGEYQRRVGEIGKKTKIVDWRYYLRESIKFDVDWSYKNASIEDGVLRANLEDIPRPEVEIVLDTSGSIDEGLLKNFLRECKNIMSTCKVKVGCFDTKFYGFHDVRNERDIENMPYEGGGGTDFDVAVGAFTRKTVNRIVFTDGYANMPKNPVRAIWVVIGDNKIEPELGTVINVRREDIDRKYRLLVKK